MISIKAFKDWLENPITKRIKELLIEDRENKIDLLVNGVPNYQSKENCLMAVGKITGMISEIDSMLNIYYELIEPTAEDNEDGGVNE